MTPSEQINQLILQIREWDTAYYGKEVESPVSDAVYDAAKMQLKELERIHPELLRPDSPSLVIGQPKSDSSITYRKVPHHVPMLSLDTQVKTTREPIEVFLEKVGDSRTLSNLRLVSEPKFDGLGLDLQYVLGDLKEAVTRGDGNDGEDVLRHIQYIDDIPKKLPKPITIDVRGEILLNRTDLATINTLRQLQGEKTYSNARNAAAGLIRAKYNGDAHRLLKFMAYEIAYGDFDALGDGQFSHIGRMDFLEQAGFRVRYRGCSHMLGDAEVLADDLYKYYTETLAMRSELPYDIDGIVYKIDDITLREELGFTGREPNWAFAHKFVPERVVTRLLDIKTGVGKTGRVTPVAQLVPVFVGGVVVTNATLVHEDRIKELGVAINDNVIVQRAGDVIPEIIGVQREDPEGYVERFDLPALFRFCPECASPLEKAGDFYYCRAGSNCPGQIVAMLEAAVSRGLLNIQGLGEQTVAQLHSQGSLHDMADIFTLTTEKLVKAGMSELLVPGVLDHIEKAKDLPLWRVVAAIGIPTCGPATAKELVKKYPGFAQLRLATEEDLQELPDIGPKTAASIVRSFANEALYDKLQAVDSSWSSTQVKSNGLTVCITGSIEGWDRVALKNKLEDLGYKTVDSVSKKTHIVIAGEGAGGKLAKARELGLKVLTTAQEVNNLLVS